MTDKELQMLSRMDGELILRDLSVEDLPFLLEVRNDESTRKWLENKNVFSLEQCSEWFKETKPQWKIILVDKIPVGYLRIDENWIGCDIHPSFRRRGYAERAYREQIKIFFDNGLNLVYLRVDEKNEGAISLYKKLGFKEEFRKNNLITMFLKNEE